KQPIFLSLSLLSCFFFLLKQCQSVAADHFDITRLTHAIYKNEQERENRMKDGSNRMGRGHFTCDYNITSHHISCNLRSAVKRKHISIGEEERERERESPEVFKREQ